MNITAESCNFLNQKGVGITKANWCPQSCERFLIKCSNTYLQL